MVLAAAVLGGCSNTTLDIVRDVAGSRADIAPDAEAIAASPYARIQVKGAGVSAVMVLGNDDDGRLSWYSDRRHVVFLRDGLLVGSAGLGRDVDGIHVEGDNPFLDLARLDGQPVAVARRYDWREGYRYGVPVTGLLQRRGTQAVEILGTTRTLVHFEETLRGPGVDARNEYWADPDTGFIWKSRQLLAPGVSLEIVQLKPYRAGRR
ncbi:YjbF family lipoprotein [Pseudoxanthomonas suwonensis]|uniref:YjbF family lipoprotein n=1 Tax=Pseudoxanthomonas suwonensis TaxID=314722 RepID=UPI001F31030A|nr:YjbF family lipoprotein [Pseudoxanthomonas suwonensis]